MATRHDTPDTDDSSPKGVELWNTNKQLFPAWYPTLLRGLDEGPPKFQQYFERLTTNQKHLVCCLKLDNNHCMAMERHLVTIVGTTANPLKITDIPGVPVPPATPAAMESKKCNVNTFHYIATPFSLL